MMGIETIEKTAWKTMWVDGAADICLGIILFVSGLGMMFFNARYYIMPLYSLPFIVSISIKRYITFPRIGHHKFEAKKAKKSFVTLAVFITVLMILITLIIKYNIFRYVSNPSILISTIIFLIFAVNAYLFDFTRMYFYAGFVTLTFLLSELAIKNAHDISAGAQVYITSSIIVFAIGLSVLSYFIKTNPKKG